MKSTIIQKIFPVIFLCTFPSLLYSSDTKLLPKTDEYKLDIKIDYGADKLYAHCEITISNHTNQPIKKIPLLLYRLLTINSVKNEKNESIPYSQNVISISGWEKVQVNFIEISLHKTLAPGDRRKIKLEYEGYLLGYSEADWRYVKDTIDREFTIIRTDGFGYPVIGYPDDSEIMAIAKERYNYLIKVTVPDEIMVVNGGKLLEKIKIDNETTYIYESIKPSWRIDIAMSDYQLLERNKNKIYYFSPDSPGAQIVMKALDQSVNLYSSWFGPPDNYQGFTVIEVPEGYGSQQDITSIMITADNFKNPDEMHVIYHEIAHLWNVSSLDPQPCRFESEGFAQFLQFLISEKLDNNENAVAEAAQRYVENIRVRFNEKQEYKSIPIKDYGVYDMTEYSYTVGMVVFAILYDLVGKNHFNKIIGSFYARYYSKGATLDEFTEHCKKNAPLDLERFFDDWIYSTNAINLVIKGKTFEELLQYYRGD